jgi:O-antigen/teichoic acid export membrane protein
LEDKPPRKFQRDVIWNFASLAVLGASGFALSALITSQYDSATYGVFNQVLAIYTVFSMIAVGGLNLSALRAVAEHVGDRGKVTNIVLGSLVPTVALAGATTAAYALSRGWLAAWFKSPGIGVGILASTPGLFFFALNKVLLSVVNGVQRMRAYAVYQALRYLLILLALLAAIQMRLDGNRLAYVFSVAEIVLFVFLAIEVKRQVVFSMVREWRDWSAIHLRYGIKSVLSGVILELNAKTDVWMLGIFLSDADVGVYSLAAMLAVDGVNQLLVVLQNMYNPILAQQIARRCFDELRAMVKKGRAWTYAFMLVVGTAAVLLFPWVANVMTKNDPDYLRGHVPFAVLMAGTVLASGYIPFSNMLLMAGRPGWHTWLMVITVVSNILLDLYMIPHFGLVGAAASTALAMVLSVFLLKAMVRARVGVRI